MKLRNLPRVILSNPTRVMSTPTRVILSNPTRVILSIAKDLAVATTLFAITACTDYLADFQDKYDDGNAFAEISSDNDEDHSSSDSNDIDSSDSKGSSSSATNGEEAHCTGTVIYDYKNPGKLGLNLQFLQNATTTKLPENGQGIELSSNTVQDYAIFALSENDLHDVSSWEGLCVEYSSNEDITLYLADLLKNMEQINLPANDHFKEISWADTTSRKISIKSGGRGRVSFNKFDLFSFGISTTQKVTISRITTIAKVDTSVNSPTLDTTSCTGSIIYDASEAPNYNVFGYGFVVDHYSEKEASSNGITSNLSQNGSLIMPLAAIDKSIDIQSWDGFCVEYLSEGSITTEIVSPLIGKKASLIYKEMPNTNGEKSSFRWSWNEYEGLMEKQKDNGVSDGFSIEKVESINFTSHSSNSTITISKITTLNSNVHFECDGSEIFPKGSIFNAFTNWSSTGQKEGIIIPSNDKYEITLSGGNSVTPNNEDALQFELANARGFCMEYSSNNYFMLSLNQYVEGNKKTNNYAEREVGKGNQRVVFVLWDELKEQFTNFDSLEKHVLELSAPKNGVEATNITISRMTLLQ